MVEDGGSIAAAASAAITCTLLSCGTGHGMCGMCPLMLAGAAANAARGTVAAGAAAPAPAPPIATAAKASAPVSGVATAPSPGDGRGGGVGATGDRGSLAAVSMAVNAGGRIGSAARAGTGVPAIAALSCCCTAAAAAGPLTLLLLARHCCSTVFDVCMISNAFLKALIVRLVVNRQACQ